MRGLVIAATLAFTPAAAQQTMCFTSGYPPNQVVTCNGPPPPDSSASEYLRQSQANFYSNLGAAIANAGARRRQARDEERAFYLDAAVADANGGQCAQARENAKHIHNKGLDAYVEARCPATPTPNQ